MQLAPVTRLSQSRRQGKAATVGELGKMNGNRGGLPVLAQPPHDFLRGRYLSPVTEQTVRFQHYGRRQRLLHRQPISVKHYYFRHLSLFPVKFWRSARVKMHTGTTSCSFSLPGLWPARCPAPPAPTLAPRQAADLRGPPLRANHGEPLPLGLSAYAHRYRPRFPPHRSEFVHACRPQSVFGIPGRRVDLPYRARPYQQQVQPSTSDHRMALPRLFPIEG